MHQESFQNNTNRIFLDIYLEFEIFKSKDDVKMADFTQIIKERRSASNFLADHPITKEELNEIFKLVKLAPSAFNLQHAKYVIIIDPAIKEKIENASYGQYKVANASAVILVLGDKTHLNRLLKYMKV